MAETKGSTLATVPKYSLLMLVNLIIHPVVGPWYARQIKWIAVILMMEHEKEIGTTQMALQLEIVAVEMPSTGLEQHVK